MGTTTPRVAAVAMLLAVAACGPGVDDDPGSAEAPETRRGPVSLASSEVDLVGETDLTVTVPSCNGDPEVVSLDEDDARVELEVVTTEVVSGDGDACLDVLDVALDTPLGDRDLVDAVSGETLRVPDLGARGAVECFDADHPVEPTFATPEGALEHTLETEAAALGAPDDPGAYEPIERAEGAVDYEVREGADVYLIWGVIEDDDGRWGLASSGGCWPPTEVDADGADDGTGDAAEG